MKVIVRGKNVTITDAIEDKITKKLALLDKYFIMGQDVEAKVLIRTYPFGQKIEVTIPIEGKEQMIEDCKYYHFSYNYIDIEKYIRNQG